MKYVIDFVPPIVGIDGDFNTIRIGLAWSKRLTVGDHVCLMDSKSKAVIGKAEVIEVETGQLGFMCMSHADKNHTELNQTDGRSSERVYALMRKLLGPHIVNYNKQSTVIYLKRLE